MTRMPILPRLLKYSVAGLLAVILGGLAAHVVPDGTGISTLPVTAVAQAQMSGCVAPTTFPHHRPPGDLPTFEERYSIQGPPPPYAGVGEVGLLDADDDGDTDIILFDETHGEAGGWEHGYESIVLGWRNQGDGTFERATRQFFPRPPLDLYVRESLVFDANGDGRMDVFGAQHGPDGGPGTRYTDGAPNMLLLQRPNHTFVDVGATNLNPNSEHGFSHSAAAADIDCDGDVDIYVGNVGARVPQLQINDGSGYYEADNFRLPFDMTVSRSTERSQYHSAEFCDVDRDGDPDLVLGAAADYDRNPDRLLLNDGEGAVL